MNKTKIEWVKNPDDTQGYTWNPITGCLNHNNGLCKGGGFPCYAYKLAHGRLKTKYLANDNLGGKPLWRNNLGEQFVLVNKKEPFYPRFWPERLEQPFNHENAGIFPCDMSDLFGIGIPYEWTEAVMNVIKIAKQNRFYLLTKQPQNLIKFSPFPENCWVGVTATANAFLTNALIGLAQIEAKHKFISFEPLLGSVGINDHMNFSDAGVDWVIIGQQTPPSKRTSPQIEWVEEIVRACDKAGIPVFLKNNIRSLLATKECFGENYVPFPFGDDNGFLRQEVPDVKTP